MMKKNRTINLLKTMVKTSYDTNGIIDADTKKLNKKSMKVWLIGIVLIVVIYLSYIAINLLKEVGASNAFLEIFFLVLQILIMFQTILLVVSTLYFSKDIENYLSLPIPSIKLLITKFSVMIIIIFVGEAIIALPSIFIYGVRTLQNIFFYPLAVIVLALVSIFLSTIVSIIMIFVMKIFRFIKNKYLYQNIIILVMTLLIFMPLTNVLNIWSDNAKDIGIVKNELYDEENSKDETEEMQELTSIIQNIRHTNKYFIVTEIGVNALSDIDYKSIIYVLEILALDLLALMIFLMIGKFTYIKDILWNLSVFNKKKNKKVNLYKKCKVRNKLYSYLRNEIKSIIKSPTYFIHYIYNILIVLTVIVFITATLFPIILQAINETLEDDIFNVLTFGFGGFSIIIGIIQVIFTLSSLSLTAISRYGKNATFFKYIPIKFKTQFRLKNMPQIIINTIIIVVILGTIHYLIPTINNSYILLMFIIAMLLNIINSNILLFLDLARPRLNYENEITVIKQNDNKLFQYILTVVMCFIIWYLNEITKELNLNMAILIEMIVFSVIVIGMEIFIHKKANKLFKKII